MKVIVEIPMEPYLLCVTRCGFKSPEYLMLKNGIVQRDSDGNEVVEILCSRERAKIILEAVAKACPEALSSIRHRLDDAPAAP